MRENIPMKNIFTALFFTLFSTYSWSSVDFETRDFIVFINNQLRIEYRRLDPQFKEIEESSRPYASSTSATENTDTVTYALHGFMGSPHEMNYALTNAKERGEVIFNDLIIGYGANSKICNSIKKEMYYKQMERNLNYLFTKFSKVNLIGFSTGGLLITKYLLEHPKYLSKVNKLRLVSPYYFPHLSFAPGLGKLIVNFIDQISIELFYRYTGFPDVEVMTLEPSHYPTHIPIKAALEIADLSEEVRNNKRILNELNDVEIYLTKEDQVLNFEKTVPFVNEIFPRAKVKTFEGKGYPHHLMAPSVSKLADIIRNNL